MRNNSDKQRIELAKLREKGEIPYLNELTQMSKF